MTVEFKVWHDGAGVFECQVCGNLVPWKRFEDKLAKHAKKHNGIALIKGEK